jgi:CheY-like chemotaxis protein
VKFTDAGGRVTVRLDVVGSSARVEVSDTGRGIDAEFLPYVWDRFRQADSSTMREHGGLGLGLSVVRHLVELHGGTVHVESEGRGRGATFAFELPLARLANEGASPWRYAADGDLLRDRAILVVDDDGDARLVLATMLRQHGAEVTTAASVNEAMTQFVARPFDVVVTDIAMPVEDGFSLARRVREKSGVPLVAVSAIASGPEDRRTALAAGFAEFVRKPVDPGQLALAVAAVLPR